MQFSAVYACINLISETLASLPLQVYRKNDQNRILAVDHPLYFLLSSEPNKKQTRFWFWKTLYAFALGWGNGYARIKRNGVARPYALELLLPGDCHPIPNIDGSLSHYNVKGEIVSTDDIIHIGALGFDGIQGKSTLRIARESVALGIAAEKFGGGFFGKGATVQGVLEYPQKLSNDQFSRLRKDWDDGQTGIEGKRTAILEGGAKYTRIGIPPEDAQFIETRKFQVTDICRWYKVPPHLIADMEHATFSNIEHQDLSYVKHTVQPWIVQTEQELNKKMFRQDEKGKVYTKHNLNALLRADIAARGQYYREMVQNGIMSRNEIRELEDLNTMPDLDKFLVQVNMTTSDMIGKEQQNNPIQNEN